MDLILDENLKVSAFILPVLVQVVEVYLRILWIEDCWLCCCGGDGRSRTEYNNCDSDSIIG